MRPSWHETWLEVARVMALRSTCLRGNVGAVIVDERNISVGLGYNGSASGERHCLDYGCRFTQRLTPSSTQVERYVDAQCT
jgi:dCMP deaminase